jgi:ketosteroid isomerase-like protein
VAELLVHWLRSHIRVGLPKRWPRCILKSIETAGEAMLNTEVVRASFAAYRAQDRNTAARLLDETFTFTSPNDDHLDKSTFLERCFPTADRFSSQEILELVPAGEDGVFVLYEYELRTGGRYRNTEFLTVRDGKLVETQVFFGGRYDRR